MRTLTTTARSIEAGTEARICVADEQGQIIGEIPAVLGVPDDREIAMMAKRLADEIDREILRRLGAQPPSGV